MASKLESLVGFLRKPKKGHFYHQNSYKGIDNYLLDCARVGLDNDSMTQEWSIKVADAVNNNADAIAENTKNIATNVENIATNTENIATNAENIASNSEKIEALQNGRVGTVRINFDYDTYGMESDKIYYTQDKNENHYSYLNLDNFEREDGGEIVDINYILYGINVLVNDQPSGNRFLSAMFYANDIGSVLTLIDNPFIRAYDDGSECVEFNSGSLLIIHVIGLAEDVEYTLIRKANT